MDKSAEYIGSVTISHRRIINEQVSRVYKFSNNILPQDY